MLTQQNVDVNSDTFKARVPKPLERHASNLLAQAETLVRDLEAISGRKRHRLMTSINIIPGQHGASAAHSGDHINFGTRLLFRDVPMLDHTFVHELAHNHGFKHGGLMELVVEVTRSQARTRSASSQPSGCLWIE